MEDNKKCTVPLWSVRLKPRTVWIHGLLFKIVSYNIQTQNLFETMNLNQMFTPLIAMILSPFCDAWCSWIKCSMAEHNNGLLRFFSTLVHFVDEKTIKKWLSNFVIFLIMGTVFSIFKRHHNKFNYLSNRKIYLIIYNTNNVNGHAVHTENKYKYKRITWKTDWQSTFRIQIQTTYQKQNEVM